MRLVYTAFLDNREHDRAGSGLMRQPEYMSDLMNHESLPDDLRDETTSVDDALLSRMIACMSSEAITWNLTEPLQHLSRVNLLNK